MMAINAVGIVAYLGLASFCWIEPELADIPGASGGAGVVWYFGAFMLLKLFCALNALWVLFAFFIFLKKRKWILHPSFLLVPACWAVAIYIDFSRHGI